jgi:hypothetical protein
MSRLLMTGTMSLSRTDDERSLTFGSIVSACVDMYTLLDDRIGAGS